MSVPVQLSSSARVTRIFYIVACALLSLACAGVYGLIMSGEWEIYTLMQVAIMISLTAVHGLGAIVLVIMLFFRFRLWLDVACVGLFLVFQLAAGVVFTLFNSQFPCTHSLGSEANCRLASFSVSIGSGVLTGLLLIYAFSLGIATCSSRSKARRAQNLDAKEGWQKPGTMIEANGVPRSAKRFSSQTTVSQESFFTPTAQPREHPTPIYSARPGLDPIQRPDTPTSVYTASTHTTTMRLGHGDIEQAMPYRPKSPMYGDVQYNPAEPPMSAVPPRLFSDPGHSGMRVPPPRTPSPASSASSYGSQSQLITPPARVLTPVQVYDPYGERTAPAATTPRGRQRFNRLSEGTSAIPSYYNYDGSSLSRDYDDAPPVPPVLRPAFSAGNLRGVHSPSHSFGYSSRSASPSVRNPPATPVPQDVGDLDDIPVITPDAYDGILRAAGPRSAY